MEIMYNSTRNKNIKLKASEAILKGLSDDGGLFVPEFIPSFDFELDDLKNFDYKETAYRVMRLLLTDFTEDELRHCINSAYDDKFDVEEIAPLTFADGAYYLELFHGSTIAFKDMALSILPHLMTTAAKKNHVEEKIIILTATSGDTGKAALAGFADVPGTGIVVFYPKNGVSAIQEKQMVTQKGKNVKVIGIKGNFDDAQTGVKNIFGDEQLKTRLKDAGFVFSSANSINIGRLVPQIVYYVYSYGTLLKNGKIKSGDKLNFVVPTGNFGNILASYIAEKMGLPVNKLICASNENKVLFDFFETGVYDRNRQFILTSSPSMDILISSNLERLIYFIADNDAQKNKAMMDSLKEQGEYKVSEEMLSKIPEFVAGYATEKKCFDKIEDLYHKTGYVIDTHTAVAGAVYDDYKKKTGDNTMTVIASTASPYKFMGSVMKAIDYDKYADINDFELIDELSRVSSTDIPRAVEEIRNADVLHDTVCEINEMKDEVIKFLGI